MAEALLAARSPLACLPSPVSKQAIACLLACSTVECNPCNNVLYPESVFETSRCKVESCRARKVDCATEVQTNEADPAVFVATTGTKSDAGEPRGGYGTHRVW